MRMDIERSSSPGPWGSEIATRPRYQPASPMPGNPYASEPAPSGDWKRYLGVVARHKWAVIIITLVGTALGVLGTRFLSRQYQAKAILWVERPSQNRQDDRDLIQAEVSSQTLDAPGWVQVATSNAVLDSVVRRLRLYITPKQPEDAPAVASVEPGENLVPGIYRLAVARDGRTFELDREDGSLVQKGTVGDTIGTTAGFTWLPNASQLTPGRKIEFSVSSSYEAAQALAKELRVRMDEGSSFLVIQLKGSDPARITQTVNAVAARTVSVAAEMKRLRFSQLADILGDQYDHARQTLDTAENNLRAYRIRTAGAIGARTYANQQRVDNSGFELAAAADQLHRDREALDAAARGGNAAVANMAAIGAARENPELALAMQEITRKQSQLRELRQRYTDEAAPVRQLQAELDSLTTTAVPQMAATASANLASREQALRPRAVAAIGAIRRIPTLELDDSRLAREVSNAEELANAVRQRYEAARLALVSSLPDVRILDGAVVPHRPAVSLAPILIALAFLTSLGLAVLGVVIREGTDTRVRTPEQVTRGMNLQILGAIPHVGSKTFGGDAAAPVIEALRALRLRVLHSHSNGNAGPLMLTITSPAMGEGKSFVSSNLALSFADAGYRTLLIDGDLRRGAQHVVMGTDMRPGLTDILAGQATMKDAVKDTNHIGLAFLPAGTRMHRAPELLLSQKLKESFEEVKGNYDVILVDSPPLAAGVDTIVLGTITKNMMLVLRSGRSELELASAKLEGMDSLPVSIIGAVLNDVRDGGAFRHYTYEDYVQSIGGTAATGRDGPRILQGATSDE
jgi:capsular exopolysaccharide synthesis family protein